MSPYLFEIAARTWPVSGVFTPAQKALYQAVLNVQKTCIPLCTERERMSLYDLHQRSTGLVSQELAALGFKLRHGDVERVYPHFLTHPVGIGAFHSLPSQHIGFFCLYDCPQTFMNRKMSDRKSGSASWFEHTRLTRWCRLSSGMVITIEPGIYVPPESSFPKEFHDIGIRIEVRRCPTPFRPLFTSSLYQDEVLVQSDHAVILSVNAPKEVWFSFSRVDLRLIPSSGSGCRGNLPALD